MSFVTQCLRGFPPYLLVHSHFQNVFPFLINCLSSCCNRGTLEQFFAVGHKHLDTSAGAPELTSHLYQVYMCVACIYEWVHLHVYGGTSTHMCRCFSRPQVDIRSLPPWFYTLLTETASLSWTRPHSYWLIQLDHLLWGFSPLSSKKQNYRLLHTHLAFMWVPGSQTQVLMLAQEAPYPPSHKGLFFSIQQCIMDPSLHHHRIFINCTPCLSTEAAFTLPCSVLGKYLFPNLYGCKQQSNKHLYPWSAQAVQNPAGFQFERTQ